MASEPLLHVVAPELTPGCHHLDAGRGQAGGSQEDPIPRADVWQVQRKSLWEVTTNQS